MIFDVSRYSSLVSKSYVVDTESKLQNMFFEFGIDKEKRQYTSFVSQIKFGYPITFCYCFVIFANVNSLSLKMKDDDKEIV